MDESYFKIDDMVVVVDVKGYPDCDDPPIVGDIGRIVDTRKKTWRVKLKRTGGTRNFLPKRIARTDMNRKDSRFIYGEYNT
jgi:hypothetical protein